MKAIKALTFVLAGAIVLFVVIGAIRSNRWHVAHSYTAPASTDAARVFDNVAHLSHWSKWNAPEDDACKASDKAIECTDGTVTIASADPDKGVFFDEKHDDDLSHGSITWRRGEGGVMILTWTDEGPLPPVFGGWLRGTIEKNIEQHMDDALRRLAAL